MPLAEPGPIALGGPGYACCWRDVVAQWENPRFWETVSAVARAMTLTGQYSHRFGISDYIPCGNPVFATNGLPAGTPTIAFVLKVAGYTNALIGKWHLGYGEKYYPE